jgi:hypothetical protein
MTKSKACHHSDQSRTCVFYESPVTETLEVKFGEVKCKAYTKEIGTR